jgi:type 2 lantibiotic biosynthesis protein LanM
MYVLGESDCHFENLIAAGEHPVLIDLETLMHPRVNIPTANRERAPEELIASDELLRDSVLRTGLLPGIPFLSIDPDFDSSGLMGDSGQSTLFVRLKWRNVNTDDVDMVSDLSQTLPKSNLPELDGLKLSPADYEADLLKGFGEMYSMLRRNTDILAVPEGLLAGIAQGRGRFVFRSTRFYSYVLTRSLDPSFLRDGVEHFVQLDVLSAALLRFNRKPRSWPLLRNEIEALERFDVPLFQFSPLSDRLEIGDDAPIKGLFAESGFDRARARLASLSERDFQVQTGLIRKAIHSQPEQRRRFPSPAKSYKPVPRDREIALDPRLIVRQIVSKLAAEAISLPSGGLTWLTPLGLPVANPFRLAPVGYSLYDGVCGIALFLAAAHLQLQCADALELCRRALIPLRRALSNRSQASTLRESMGIGGASGLGSIVYSLVAMADLLNTPELLEDACKAAALITPNAVEEDDKLDVLAGSAGAILGLDALHRDTGSFFEPAVSCG